MAGNLNVTIRSFPYLLPGQTGHFIPTTGASRPTASFHRRLTQPPDTRAHPALQRVAAAC